MHSGVITCVLFLVRIVPARRLFSVWITVRYVVLSEDRSRYVVLSEDCSRYVVLSEDHCRYVVISEDHSRIIASMLSSLKVTQLCCPHQGSQQMLSTVWITSMLSSLKVTASVLSSSRITANVVHSMDHKYVVLSMLSSVRITTHCPQ